MKTSAVLAKREGGGMKASTALVKAANLISRPEKWCKGDYENEKGQHCAAGALWAVTPGLFLKSDYVRTRAYNFLVDACGGSILLANDDAKTTHGDVMTTYALAIALAEDAGD